MEGMLHALFAIIIFGPICLSLWGYFKWRKTKSINNKSEWKKWKVIPTIFNSAMLYALAYNIIYFIQELFLALGKKWIGLKGYLYHNNHNWEGSDPRDALMQGLGALVIFVLGLLLIPFFLKIRKSHHWTSIFVLWLVHQGLIQSLPQLSSVPVDKGSDVGQAFNYLQLGTEIEFALSYISLAAIIILAYYFSKWFLSYVPLNINLSHGFARFKAIIYLAVIPSVLGTILLFPYRIFPVDRYQMTVMLLIVCIPSIFAFSWMVVPGDKYRNEVNERILKLPIILMILVLIFFQVILAPGVVFE